jgi:hypothetical protein
VPGAPGCLRDDRRAARTAAATAALRGGQRRCDDRSLSRPPPVLRPDVEPRRGHLPEVRRDGFRTGAARGEAHDRGARRAEAAARGLTAGADSGARAALRLLRPGQSALRVRERGESARWLRRRDGPQVGAGARGAARVRAGLAQAVGWASERRDLRRGHVGACRHDGPGPQPRAVPLLSGHHPRVPGPGPPASDLRELGATPRHRRPAHCLAPGRARRGRSSTPSSRWRSPSPAA